MIEDPTDPPGDGAAWLARRLAAMRDAVARGEPVIAVFDLDNTVFDTRPRTLAAARDFDRERGSAWFATLALDGVRRDGRTTARDVVPPIPDAIVDAFAAYWDIAFWRPEAFALDTPIADVVRWAHAAEDAGLVVRALTGRIQSLHEASVAALARIGLPLAADAVVCKPDLGVRTAPWKCEVLGRWRDEARVAWFITEGRRDVGALQTTCPAVDCVLLECSFESPRHEVDARTPRLARIF